MGVARARSRLNAPPNPLFERWLERGGVRGLALPQLGGKEGRGAAGLTTPPSPRCSAVGDCEGRGQMWPHPQLVFL